MFFFSKVPLFRIYPLALSQFQLLRVDPGPQNSQKGAPFFVLSLPTTRIQVKIPRFPYSPLSLENQVCFSHDCNTLASGSDDKSIRLWDVKTGQSKSKLDRHTSYIMSVCFSPDSNTLASGSDDKSISLWDVKTRKGIQSTDKSYKDILAQFKTLLFQNYPLLEISTNFTILLISQQAIFQAQGTLILKGEFVNQSGIDLTTLFKQKGSCILEKPSCITIKAIFDYLKNNITSIFIFASFLSRFQAIFFFKSIHFQITLLNLKQPSSRIKLTDTQLMVIQLFLLSKMPKLYLKYKYDTDLQLDQFKQSINLFQNMLIYVENLRINHQNISINIFKAEICKIEQKIVSQIKANNQGKILHKRTKPKVNGDTKGIM